MTMNEILNTETTTCWDTVNSDQHAHQSYDFSSYASKFYIIFLLFVNLGVPQKIIDVATKGRYTDSLLKYIYREIMWIHGISTYTLMCATLHIKSVSSFFGITSLSGVLKYSIQSVLVIILYDLLTRKPRKLKDNIMINSHHLGLFIAMYFGAGWDIGNTNETLMHQAKLDASLYGWMWSIHSFGFVLKHVFPLVGINVKEGERSQKLEVIKHMYSMVTAYLYYQYFYSKHQPGIGWNYQTMSLCTMLIGRFLPNGHIDYLRRIEMPTMFILMLNGILFNDKYMHRSIAVALSMLTIYVYYHCYIKKPVSRPAKFVPPSENPLLKKFIEDEAEAVLLQSESSKESDFSKTVEAWFIGNTINMTKHAKVGPTFEGKERYDPSSWAAWYPLHHAVIKQDADMAEKILQTVKFDVDMPLLEHYDTTALQFARDLIVKYNKGGASSVLYVLLKYGANPYVKSSAVQVSFDAMLEIGLGNSKDFFRRYNEICLEKSPPDEVYSELPLMEKLKRVPL